MSKKQHRRKTVTADELMSRLENNPDFIARRQRAEAERQKRIAENELAEAPVVEDLVDAGFSVESIDELRRSGFKYKAAVPILLKWLPTVNNFAIKESIVRALSVPWAKPAAALPLVREFQAAPCGEDADTGLKWAIGNALSIVADDSVFDEITELVRDKKHGKSREMLAVALGKMKNPAAADVLIELLNDDEVAGHALMGLSKLKAQKARPHIERFVNHPKPWFRKEASKALAKLNK